MAQQRAEAKASDRTSGQGQGSGSGLPYGLPATLPNLTAGEEVPAKLSDPAPSAPKRGKKRSHADDDDDITELPVGDEPVLPPKKKKKKKNKDKSKEEIPIPDVPDDSARPSSSSAKPEEAMEPTSVADPSGIPDEETEKPKKKKKKKKKKHKEDTSKEPAPGTQAEAGLPVGPEVQGKDSLGTPGYNKRGRSQRLPGGKTEERR